MGNKLHKPYYYGFADLDAEREEKRWSLKPLPYMLAVLAATLAAGLIFLCITAKKASAAEIPPVEQIASAIYKAEGGTKTNHPYGILTRYKHTTPKQACINTINHALRDWNGKGDFIVFLGNRYCPVGARNDPRGLNKNWVRNVKYFLARAK